MAHNNSATPHNCFVFILVDHADSFSYNLKDLLHLCSPQSDVLWTHSDQHNLTDLVEKTLHSCSSPVVVVLSPGPNEPRHVMASSRLYERFRHRCSFLGVCLGHQIMGTVEGYELTSTSRIYHGGTKKIHFVDTIANTASISCLHNQSFATYNSLTLKRPSHPNHHPHLHIIAFDEDGNIAALAGRSHNPSSPSSPQFMHLSVQFHPESFLSQAGQQLITLWLHSPSSFLTDG